MSSGPLPKCFFCQTALDMSDPKNDGYCDECRGIGEALSGDNVDYDSLAKVIETKAKQPGFNRARAQRWFDTMFKHCREAAAATPAPPVAHWLRKKRRRRQQKQSRKYSRKGARGSEHD